MRSQPALCAFQLFAGIDAFDDADLVVTRLSIGSDLYFDGRLNPGDTAKVFVNVRNRGGEPDGALRCTVTGGAAGVRVSAADDSLFFGYCTGLCDSSFGVEVDPDVAPGTQATFRCDLGLTDLLTFTVPIEAPDVALVIDQIAVEDDPTDDGALNPGESARLRISLRNTGTASLDRLSCVVGSDTVGVDVLASDDSLLWSRCEAGGPCGESTVRVQVSPEVPPGTRAALRCDLVDPGQQVIPLTFEQVVEAPAARPRVDGPPTIEDDGGDGALGPGEAARLVVALTNAGVSRLPNAACTVASDVAWLEVLESDATLNFSSCDADSDCRSSSVRVRAADDAPPGATATLSCPLEDALGAIWPLSFTLILANTGT